MHFWFRSLGKSHYIYNEKRKSNCIHLFEKVAKQIIRKDLLTDFPDREEIIRMKKEILVSSSCRS